MKTLFKAIATALTVCMSVSCAIVDYAPIELKIRVTDTGGKDLLDPEYNDTEWLEGTTLTFDNRTVVLNTKPQVKSLGPVDFNGFNLIWSEFHKCYLLTLGELDGEMVYDDMTFTIGWRDGKTDVITYNRHFAPGMYRRAKEKWEVNGKKTKDWPLLIVK